MSHWVEAVPKKDLAMIHHACRMFAKYPGLKDEDKRETTRVADLAWDEIARRTEEVVGGRT